MPYLILTEENPQVAELEYILMRVGLPQKISSLEPSFHAEKQWSGKFLALSEGVPISDVYIQLFKGKGACVDYMVYDTLTPTAESIPILLLESTKTSDKESRNSSVYQRFTKFAEVRLAYPTTPLVLYYTQPQNPSTATALFGLRMLKTHGVTVIDSTGKDLLSSIKAFETVEEVLLAKNSMTKHSKNVSVEIKKVTEHAFTISAKLCKGTAKDLNHDPNIGLVTAISTTIHHLDKDATFLVTHHGLDTEKLRPTAKFWYANRNYSLKLEGCPHSTKDVVHETMPLVFESQSEKAATILFETLSQKEKGLSTLFHNHSASARSFFTLPDKKTCQVPKTCSIPDVVLLDSVTKKIYICEGKVYKCLQKGIQQLDELTEFEKFLSSHYVGYTVEKGLCLYSPKHKTLPPTKYPVWFLLQEDGSYTLSL